MAPDNSRCKIKSRYEQQEKPGYRRAFLNHFMVEAKNCYWRVTSQLATLCIRLRGKIGEREG
jgi:hypothetical protein